MSDPKEPQIPGQEIERHLNRQKSQADEAALLAFQHIWSNTEFLHSKETTNSQNPPDELLTLGPYKGYFRELAEPAYRGEAGKARMIIDFIIIERTDGRPATIDHVELSFKHTGQGGFVMGLVD